MRFATRIRQFSQSSSLFVAFCFAFQSPRPLFPDLPCFSVSTTWSRFYQFDSAPISPRSPFNSVENGIYPDTGPTGSPLLALLPRPPSRGNFLAVCPAFPLSVTIFGVLLPVSFFSRFFTVPFSCFLLGGPVSRFP